MKNKEIDIIIPAYKAHETIFKTLCSIAEQDSSNKILVTIVNDCCPEGNYKKIINLFKGHLDIQELKMIKNVGPGAARQFGVDHTSAPYIMFMDADDSFMGPYSVSDIYAFVQDENRDITFGSFIEQADTNKYMPHMQDHIWVFGKIYKREFLKKNNIRFSNHRANEDTCFNKQILLMYENLQLDIPYIDSFIYAWNMKENSITKINNGQYTYDQSVCGFIDGTIEVFDWAEKQSIREEVIKKNIMQEMIFLYITYCDVGCYSEVFQEQNLEYIKKFYNLLWKKYDLDYHNQLFIDSYEWIIPEMMQGGQLEPKIFMAQPSIVKFMDMLADLPYNPDDIYDIWDRIPQELKNKNIECGVCDADYYKRKRQ